jgi:hypothetical protein
MLTKIRVAMARNAELDDHLGFDKHKQSDSGNNRTVTRVKPCRLKTASLKCTHLGIDQLALNLSWSKSIRAASRQWTTRFCSSTRRG